MKTPSFVSSAAAAVAILLLVPAARAQMDWSAPVDIVDDSDVSTTGQLTYAYVFGGTGSVASQTVNGVTFLPFAIPEQQTAPLTIGNVTLSGVEFDWNTTGTVQDPYAQLSADYQVLLAANAFSHQTALNLTLAGLTAGQTYEVQLWVNNSFNTAINYDTAFTYATQVSSVVSANTSNMMGGLGQYIIGTVTLGEAQTDLTITLNPASSDAGVNAVQIRAVPEPGVTSCVLGGLIVVGWMALRRSRRSTVT